MRIRQNGKQFVIFYMVGFVIGIFYANIIAKNYLMAGGVFSDYYLNQYANMDIVLEDYLLYIMRIRLLPLGLIAILACTKLKKVTAIGAMAWTGFLSGVILVEAIMKMGVKGIALCLLGVMPQFIFYALGYIIILWTLYTYPNTKWNVKKTVFVLLMIGIGIIMEGYVNPILMKMFLSVL